MIFGSRREDCTPEYIPWRATLNHQGHQEHKEIEIFMVLGALGGSEIVFAIVLPPDFR